MIGKQVLHYKIVDKLGEGGMGVVYKAEDSKLGRTVALKFMPPDISNDAKSKERFIREAQAVAALDHPNLCTIHAIEEAEDGRMFIAMACYDGEALGKRIEAGPLDIEETVDIALAAAEGLTSAHARGIVHRDIKPANIFLVKDGPVKVVDFGLAKWAGKSDITKTGVTVGTVPYMSPEQVRGEELDARTDIWALGVVMYEMLSGRRPFSGDYEQAAVYSILNEEPAPVSESRPDVPAGLERIVSWAMSKAPDERYATAEELFEDLLTFRDSKALAEEKDAAAKTGRDPSIAVLPFTNMSPDPENEYFGDGLAEELINALAGLRGLRVAARTSAFRFRGEDLDVRDIGRRLNVDTVLEGSVRRSGNTLRVTAQLIDAKDGFHLWSGRFDRKMEDIFAIQDEITEAIVDRMKVELIGGAATPLVKRYTDDIEAYNLYLKGRYYMMKLSPEGWAKSAGCFNAALERDPSFAPAYAGLADHRGSQTYWGGVAPRDGFPYVKKMAQKALALDETIADAHGSMAVAHFSYDWDAEAAETEFARAFELDPTSAIGRINYSLFLLTRKRFEEAEAAANRAAEIDPLSAVVLTWAAMVPSYTDRPSEAMAMMNQAVELDPAFWQPYHHMAFTSMFECNWDKAIECATKAVEMSAESPVALEGLAMANYRAGRTADGDAVLRRLEERAADAWVGPSVFFLVHLSRGDENEAYRQLERAVAERDPWLLFYGVTPRHLRSEDPRFDRLIESTGLAT